jgi:ribosomal protein S3
MGVQCIASDSQASGTITLADASGIVFGDEGIEVRTSTQAAVELDDASTQASATSVQGTTLVACWQTNTMAVVAEQRIAVRVAARSSVASLTGVNWGIGDGSPANF